MRSGITRRWLRGNLLITVLLVLLAETMFLYNYTRSYYNSVQQTMYRRFSSVSGQLKMYTGDTVQSTAATRSVALRRMVEQFADKDKYEFMLLDSYGGVIASSSGTNADGIVTGIDFEQAQEASDGLGVAVYRTQSGELVMAACYLVPYAAEDVAAMRLVTSLTLVGAQIKNAIAVSVVIAAVILAFTVMSGLYFIRSIVVPLYNTPQQFLVELLDSVQNQTYQNWELCLVDAGQDETVGQTVAARAAEDPRIRYQKLEKNEGIAGNTNQGFALATGEFIALLDHDDILHPCALWYVAQAIAEQGADFVYTDEVTFEGDIDHLTVYHFKPDYMLDNLRSNNYICHLSVFSAKLLAAVGGDERAAYNGSQDYDLYLRLTEKAHKIVHIPHLLYYWRSSPTSVASNISAKTYCLEAAVKALYAHYERVGVPVDEVSMIPGTPGFYKTDYTITKPGRVSILIPSCDHSSDLRTCVESIYRRSTYEDLEIIVIENNSREPATFRCYEKLQKEHKNLKVITWQGTGFNYSALNNFGAKEATGEYLLLLNNDTEVISPRWIEEMLMYAQQDRVGCVGAKLLYPDNTIQHAGIGFGFLTLAAHMHKNFPVGHPGYMGRLVYAQDVYAVTAACLMVRRSVYEQVNGLDESFAVAFNDVDFCVRVREAGYTNVFTPFAQLYHYESKSRGLDENPVKRKRFISEVERFQKRWAKQLAAGDPCMNPNFDLMKEDFSFDIKPLE
jgi:GT2 family glycosyltransferase